MESTQHRPGLLATAIVLAIFGLALVAGGGWLIALGGSWYYLCAGVALLATSILLVKRRPVALYLYALLVIATLAWGLWEAGLDWWPLAARGDVLFIVGIFLLMPWITRPLSANELSGADLSSPAAPICRGGGLALAAALGLFLFVAIASWFVDPQHVDGELPGARAQPVADAGGTPPGEWHAYGRDGHGQRYSPLTQITPDNVDQLEVAWHFKTGDVRGRPGDPVETTFEVTPLKIGNRLYLCTPHQSVIALDATTGEQIWRYEPQVQGNLALQHLTCRGVSYQKPAANPASPECPAKLFMPTADGRVIALNPENGGVCTTFGQGKGYIDLWENMPHKKPGGYYSTSPAVVTDALLIVGGTVLDNVSTQETSGVIRAYDINTGDLAWNWDAGNPDETAPLPRGSTYTPNSPNSWSISSVDEELGMVYVPLGNQPPDQWGAERSEAVERYSSSVVALDLATGQVRWHFQTVHHDLWDYDVPSQPSLIDLTIGGQTVPALVQPTKQGELFVLDRRSGEPVLPITEKPVPQRAVEGERLASTQPVSGLSFDPPALTGADMWGATMFDQLACRIAFQKLRYEGRYTPPSLEGTLVYPGNFGVFNWGGIAVDPQRQIAFTTPTYLAFISQLVPRADDTTLYVQGESRPQDSLPALNENFGAPFAVKLSAFTSALGLACHARRLHGATWRGPT